MCPNVKSKQQISQRLENVWVKSFLRSDYKPRDSGKAEICQKKRWEEKQGAKFASKNARDSEEAELCLKKRWENWENPKFSS